MYYHFAWKGRMTTKHPTRGPHTDPAPISKGPGTLLYSYLYSIHIEEIKTRNAINQSDKGLVRPVINVRVRGKSLVRTIPRQ